MKTLIVRLEPHDDFISARDKLGWNQAGRIMLVYPEGDHILNRRLDLELLLRRSGALGAQLCIVTDNPEVKYQARLVGIPVFGSIQKAQKSNWKDVRRSGLPDLSPQLPDSSNPDLEAMRKAAHPEESKYLSNPGTRLAFFLLGVLALLSIAAVLVPSAEIRLLPEVRTQELRIDVLAKPGIEAVNFSGQIPSRLINAIVEGRSSSRATGSLRVPLEYARGTVQFTNLTDQEIQIPGGMVVRTTTEPSVRFATTRDARLSPGVGRTSTVPVVALEPGKAGNLGPGRLSAIESDLGASMTATNPYPTGGGEDSTLSSATPQNKDELYKKMEAELRQTALEEMSLSVPAGDIVFSQTITISQVIAEDYDPEHDLPSEQISLNLRIEYQALSASLQDLEQLAEYALDASLPDMYTSIPNSLQINPLTEPISDDLGNTRWQIRVQRQIRSSLPANLAINQVLGLPPETASQTLKNALSIQGEPIILVTPAWWPRLPVLPFRFVVSTQ